MKISNLIAAPFFSIFAAVNGCIFGYILGIFLAFFAIVWKVVDYLIGCPIWFQSTDITKVVTWYFFICGATAFINTFWCVATGKDNWFNAMCLTQDQRDKDGKIIES